MADSQTIFRVGPRDRGKRLDHFLHERIPALSRTWVQKVIVERVAVSWSERARPSTRVCPGGEVRVGFTPLDETPSSVVVPVLARGPGWMAVDKPAGIPVHPVNRVRENSLIRILRRQEKDDGLRLAHRLDRETSGVLLIASNPIVSRALSVSFERREVHKEYLALVAGEVVEDCGEITFPIGPAVGSRVYFRLAPSRAGKPSRTAWRVEARSGGRTLLRLFPTTGRRHQLRVHLAAIGHPIVGDLLYGRGDDDYLELVRTGHDVRRDGPGPRRQMLHCARLKLPDSVGDGEIDVVAPLPGDVKEAFAPLSRVL